MAEEPEAGSVPAPPAGAVDPQAKALAGQVAALRAEVVGAGEAGAAGWADVPEHHQSSVRNLLHYLQLRRGDLRDLQEQLAELGLSSLGRSEAGVLGSLEAVSRALDRLAGRTPAGRGSAATPEALTPRAGHRLLEERTEQLFGPPREGRSVRIMVTLPSEAAVDAALVRRLLVGGMDAARINCAHDDRDAWVAMATHVRRAAADLGRPCRILADLAGPKLRTGPVAPGPAVRKVRPRRDALGRVVAPAHVLLAPDGATASSSRGDPTIPVPARWVQRLEVGDKVRVRDTRGALRELRIVHVGKEGARAETAQTVYFAPGVRLQRRRGPSRRAEAKVGHLPAAPGRLDVHVGDTLVLTKRLTEGRPGRRDAAGRQRTPSRVGCTLPEAFSAARKGQAIWFDDGKIGGVIRTASSERLVVEVVHAPLSGALLGGDKGINLPDATLGGSGLTPKDLDDLDFVVEHADAVGLSFVRTPADVRLLQDRLAAAGASRLGIVLKIESRAGFEHLPVLLLAGLRSPQIGVMIARGDLAIECGFERLSEVQEEILWLAEAAHVPVVWATQVLEGLAKHGQPSRAEVTDAAMGERAECVMLNKGPHILEAVRMLDGILRRMETHQRKKRPTFRPLSVARRAFTSK